MGNLTRAPELHYSPENKAYCRFGLAVERPKEHGNWAGERVTEFYEVTCFGTLTEHVAQSLTKGARALVVGRGEVEHWTDDEGHQRATKRILADACGPDLRWATVTVERTKPPENTRSGSKNHEEPF